jgi:hypothetical protein
LPRRPAFGGPAIWTRGISHSADPARRAAGLQSDEGRGGRGLLAAGLLPLLLVHGAAQVWIVFAVMFWE